MGSHRINNSSNSSMASSQQHVTYNNPMVNMKQEPSFNHNNSGGLDFPLANRAEDDDLLPPANRSKDLSQLGQTMFEDSDYQVDISFY